MTKFITTLLLLGTLFCSNAQVQPVGSPNYGRLDNITYDNTIENKLYASTLGNHLVSSNDNGNTWEIYYTYPASVNLQGIKQVNNNLLSFNVYLSNNFDNTAVYVLDKNSKSVVKTITPPTPSGAEAKWIRSYDISVTDSDYVIINIGYKIGISSYYKVYLTKDGGNVWYESYDSQSNNSIASNKVYINPNNKEKMYITLGFGPTDADGGFLISEDGGLNWEDKFPGLEYGTLGFHPTDESIFYVGNQGGFGAKHPEKLYKTIDGGDNFTEFDITWTDQTLNAILGIYVNPKNTSHIVLLEENEVVVSTDNGATWNNQDYPAYNLDDTYNYGTHLSFNPFVNNEVIITSGFRAFKSNDGGASLGNKMLYPYFTTFNVGVFNGDTNHLYYDMQGGVAHKNLVSNQENVYNPNPIDMASVNDGGMFVDKNHEGQVFKVVSGFMGSNLSVSKDHGATFNAIFMPGPALIYAIESDPSNENIVYVSLNSGQFVKIDFTDAFNAVPTDIVKPAEKELYAFVVNPNDSNNIVITLTDEIYETTDGGETWNAVNITLDSGEFLTDIVQNPNNLDEFVVASNKGIYKTADLENWTKVFTGNNVRKLMYSTAEEGKIVGAIYSGEFIDAQLLYTNDNADTWNVLPYSKISNVTTNNIDFTFENGIATAYMATGNLGVVKVSFDLDVSLSTPNIGLEKTISVYPNPSSANMTVKITNKTIKTIEVYSLTGKNIDTVSNSNTLDVSNYSKGIYLLKVLTSDNDVYLRKIIKE